MSMNVTRLFSPLRSLLGQSDQARDVSRSLLLLRLENTRTLGSFLDRLAMQHLLEHLTQTLGQAVRPYDPVQLAAPGHFSVLLHNRTLRDAAAVARRLLLQGQGPVSLAGQQVTPVMTGVLIHADAPDLPPVAAMMENARQRMQMVAEADLGRLSLYSHDPQLCGPRLPSTVSDAIVAGQMVAWFQPQICCNSGDISGFEALARWHHPVHGLLTPGAFLAQMTPADHNTLALFMLAQALSALRCWDEAGFQVPTVSINISNCELSDRGFADCLLWEMDRHDIPPSRLVVEVLESVGPMTSNAETRDNLRRLARAGCRIDLDDFGTGYASLDAIRQFGINRIKIDRSFVTGCDLDEGQQRMILAILALAERLGLSVLAEGVETREEFAFLSQMGCDELQGYAIERPMPLSDSCAFLARHRQAAADLPTIAWRG
ncbi:EAL domain-containing protein [Paracoccus gahaiensis]|uniref:EAL domain-containing protein n=1 Tax=Paracoccus gahaiensis TaxID=1706839 RepID=A0A4U0RPA6_9RHOB|nr:EAL domain-containing protein [Paracoccus gahaiensis]TJZ90024.1 EAL domain-containing protein [Paracoccus gahaiensis]